MLAGLSFVIFAIVFGILVDRYDHINRHIDSIVNFEASTTKILIDTDIGFHGFLNGGNLLDEEFTKMCIMDCYKGDERIFKNYMEPNTTIYANFLDASGHIPDADADFASKNSNNNRLC